MTEKSFRPAQAKLIADAFERYGVEYLFIGKGGAILLGYPGASQDVALFPRKSPENCRRIVSALRKIGFALGETDKRAAGRRKDLVEIDLLEAFREAYEKRAERSA